MSSAKCRLVSLAINECLYVFRWHYSKSLRRSQDVWWLLEGHIKWTPFLVNMLYNVIKPEAEDLFQCYIYHTGIWAEWSTFCRHIEIHFTINKIIVFWLKLSWNFSSGVAWLGTHDKPSPEPMMTHFTYRCVSARKTKLLCFSSGVTSFLH